MVQKKRIKPNIPLTTVREKIKTFTTTGTVVNLSNIGSKCILSPCTVRKMGHSWRITELGRILGSPSVQIYNYTPSPFQLAIWKGCHKNKLMRATNTCKCLELQHCHLDWKSAMVRLDENRALWPHTPMVGLASKE